MSEFWSGFWIGVLFYMLLGILLNQLKIWLIKRLIKKVLDKTEEPEIFLRLEKHGDMLYCYRKDTEEFIGQAKTVEEISKIFKTRYPHNDGRILKEDATGV